MKKKKKPRFIGYRKYGVKQQAINRGDELCLRLDQDRGWSRKNI